MARPLRIQYPGALYHVMSRGNERRAIVRDDADRQRRLDWLCRTVETYRWRLHVFVLMTNHDHLFVQTPDANLSAGMQFLNGSYTSYFNRRLLGSSSLRLLGRGRGPCPRVSRAQQCAIRPRAGRNGHGAVAENRQTVGEDADLLTTVGLTSALPYTGRERLPAGNLGDLERCPAPLFGKPPGVYNLPVGYSSSLRLIWRREPYVAVFC